MFNIENINQIFILFFSSLSIFYLSGKKNIKCGFILGLCGQPFWLYTTFVSEQWGIFLVSFWFVFNYIRGLINCETNIEKN